MTNGRVALVTGATSGIGLETARALARDGWKVVITARDPTRGQAVCAEIGAELRIVDLERPAEVRALAAWFRDHHDRLDLLVNNAGAIFSTRAVTADGFERTFALNHLAYHALTVELLDLLKRSAPSRVVLLSSDAHRAGRIHWDDLQSTRWRASGWPAYCQSKLANLLFARELARRLEGSGVTVNAVHPGLVASGFARNNGVWMRLGMRLVSAFSRSVTKGAETVIWAATAPELEGVSGQYFTDRRSVTPARAARDDDAARRLWSVTETLLQAVP